MSHNNFPPEFRSEDIAKIKLLIKNSTSFTMVGLPALGISIFANYLSTQLDENIIYVDINELSKLTSDDFFQHISYRLGIKSVKDELLPISVIHNKVREMIASSDKKVVFIFNRFDQLNKSFDVTFFNNLRSIRDVDHKNVVMIFTSNKPLVEYNHKAFDNGNLNMFSKSYYLLPYSEADLRILLDKNYPNIKVSKQIFDMSGGHYQLLQLLFKSELSSNFLSDYFICIQMQKIYQNFNRADQIQLNQIARGKNPRIVDELLLKIGVVKQSGKKLELFTPILNEYINSLSPLVLRPQEQKLFEYLNSNINNFISKDRLFNYLWPSQPENATDWALDALIYRLRSNAQFSNRYLIENQKRVGYKLIDLNSST